MNLRQAAEMVLKRLDMYFVEHGNDDDFAALQALRQALAEPEQEPVAAHQALEALDELESCARGDEPFNHFAAPLIRQFIEQALAQSVDLAKVGEIGVWGHKRQWVGLSDEEISEYAWMGPDAVLAIKEAQEILKERNT